MRILLPYDGSAGSRAAVQFLLKRPAEARELCAVTLLHVLPPAPPRSLQRLGVQRLAEHARAMSQRMLEPVRRRLTGAGLRVRAVSAAGSPAERIVRIAAARQIDLVLMGSRGRGAVGALLFGSTALGVLARSAVPVLVVRRAGFDPAGTVRIGVAIDASGHALAALDAALRLRPLFGGAASLHLAHVVDEIPIQLRTALANLTSTEFSHEKVRALRQEAFEAAMRAARRRLKAARVEAGEAQLVGSNPGDALARWAAREHLDLLAMGTHGRTALAGALLGSVTARVGARCEVPLLLAREG